MTFERAKELFYKNAELQEQFDYWEIDRAIATINVFISDMEELTKEEIK